VTEQHARILRLLRRALRARGDDRHRVFGELARLVAVREILEEDVVHPLTRRLAPDEHLADRLLDEERRISEALADAVRADAAGDPSEADQRPARPGAPPRPARGTPRVPQLRMAVPADEQRQLTRVARAAEEPAADNRSPGEDPAGRGRGLCRRRWNAYAMRRSQSREVPAWANVLLRYRLSRVRRAHLATATMRAAQRSTARTPPRQGPPRKDRETVTITTPHRDRQVTTTPTRRGDPVAEMEQLQDQMGQIISSLLRGPLLGAGGQQAPVGIPPADIEETDDADVLELDLPGVRNDDVHEASLHEGVLTVRVGKAAPRKPRQIEVREN
jgi:HSP20 family molecular chaperone IbpA